MNLTDEEKAKILVRSREAQIFIKSTLYSELREWVKKQRDLTAAALVLDSRTEDQKNLTRAEFVERMSAYWLNLQTIPNIFKQWSKEAEQLREVEKLIDNEKAH